MRSIESSVCQTIQYLAIMYCNIALDQSLMLVETTLDYVCSERKVMHACCMYLWYNNALQSGSNLFRDLGHLFLFGWVLHHVTHLIS
jgi:hypothetical protein